MFGGSTCSYPPPHATKMAVLHQHPPFTIAFNLVDGPLHTRLTFCVGCSLLSSVKSQEHSRQLPGCRVLGKEVRPVVARMVSEFSDILLKRMPHAADPGPPYSL